MHLFYFCTKMLHLHFKKKTSFITLEFYIPSLQTWQTENYNLLQNDWNHPCMDTQMTLITSAMVAHYSFTIAI